MNDLVSLLIFGARLTLGAVFLLAGLIKWLDSKAIENALHRLCSFPRSILPLIATGLALCEMLLGLTMLLNWHARTTSAIGFALLLAFTGFLFVQYRRGATEGCGCFGSSQKDRISLRSFVRNSTLLGLSSVVYLWPDERSTSPLIVALLFMSVIAVARRLTSSNQPIEARARVQDSANALALSRRGFLHRLGRAALGSTGVILLDRLGVRSALAQYYCPCTQTYSHWEYYCGTFGCSQLQRRHHVWQRTCESCDCGCYSYCRTDWCCGVYTCEVCDHYCDSITPYCGCACNFCNPCNVCTD